MRLVCPQMQVRASARWERMSMDAITIQILRNKITSLVDEKH